MATSIDQETRMSQMRGAYSSQAIFDPDSPMFVGKGIIASAITGAAVGATAGFHYNVDTTRAAVETSQRWFVMGASFFASREYIVSPLLLHFGTTPSHIRRMEALSEKQRGKLPEEAVSLDDIRHNRVLDSALAGGLSFGVYSFFTRGSKIVPRATLTAALMAAALQYTVNYTRLARLRLLSSSATAEPEPEKEERLGVAQQIKRSSESPTQELDVPVEENIGSRFLNVLSYVAPLKRISREEAYEKLLEQKRELDERLEEIEREENMLFEAAQRMMEQRLADSMKQVGTP